MGRRDITKAAGTLLAATSVVGVAASRAQVGLSCAGGSALFEITPVNPDAFIPERLAAKTIIVANSA